MRRDSAVKKAGIIAKKLSTVVDFAVFIAIQHQKAVFCINKAGKLPETVAVMVKMNPRIQADGDNAIAAQIQHQRIATGRARRIRRRGWIWLFNFLKMNSQRIVGKTFDGQGTARIAYL